MPRKTIPVTTILESGNHFIANSPDDAVEARVATANFMETLLHEADAYAGYQYLESAKARGGDYNIAWVIHRLARQEGFPSTMPTWDDYCEDESRRVYLTATHLREEQ